LPRISEFFGILIYMYWFDNQKHKVPHLHARYSGKEAVFDFNGNCLEGNIGSRAAKLVKEWCQEKREEIEKAWQSAIKGKEIPWITPLQ
jgi:hypothetical protein